MGSRSRSWLVLVTLSLTVVLSSGTKSTHRVCTSKTCTLRAAFMIKSMNLTVRPCDDFYQYACGNWQQGSRSHLSSEWSHLSGIVLAHLHRLLQKPLNVSESPTVVAVKKIYKSCTNMKTLKRLGDQPILDVVKPLLKKLATQDLTSKLLLLESVDTGALVSVNVGLSPRNSNRYILFVGQSGLNLRRYQYLEDSSFQIRSAYATIIAKALKLVFPGQNSIRLKGRARRVLRLETALANITYPSAAEMDVKVYRMFHMHKKYPDINWRRLMQGIFDLYGVAANITSSTHLVSSEERYLAKVFPLLRATGKQVLFDFFVCSIVFRLLPYTMGPLHVDTYDDGDDTEREREMDCLVHILHAAPHAIGHMYSKAYSNQLWNMATVALLKRIMQSFGGMINSSRWLSSKTKRRSMKKLKLMKPEVGTPVMFRNASLLDLQYGGLPLTAGGYLNNSFVLSCLRSRRQLELYVKPRGQIMWTDSAAEPNAYYSSSSNSFFVPSAILNPNLFSLAVPSYLNYGGLGFILGHEITHGFDSDGRKYDAHGNLRPWWSKTDIHQYKKRAKCFVRQYWKFKSKRADTHVNGEQTLDENIADNGGVTAAFLAFQHSLTHNSTGHLTMPGLTTMTPQQMFFLAFAQVWCNKLTVSALYHRLNQDVHSPGKYRVLGALMNSPHFAHAFHCAPGSYMNPAHKCCIW